MLLAAQYLRVSTDKQRYSTESQSAAIAEYAAGEGLEIVRTYTDEAKSGVTIAGRDGLKSLIQDVMSGAPFSTVLVLDVSRWGRFQDPDQAAHYEFLCREAGVSVRYCAEPFENDGSPTTNLIKSMKRVMAAEYSRQLSDRCRAGLRRHTLAGWKGGGVAPYGFSRQIFESNGAPGRVLSPGERHGAEQVVRLALGPVEEQDTLRLIFRLFVKEAMGPTAIASVLNESGVAYRRPGPWGAARIRYVLQNEIATGIYTINRTNRLLGKIIRNPPDQWIRIKACAPVISSKLFKAAQKKLNSNTGKFGTDDEVIEQLRRLLSKHGYLSHRLICDSPEAASSSTYVRRFGSMGAAWERVPYQPARVPYRLSAKEDRQPETVVRRLRDLLTEKGYLSADAIRATPYLPSPDFIARQFGSLSNAYAAAGFHMSKVELAQLGRQRSRAVQAALRAEAMARQKLTSAT